MLSLAKLLVGIASLPGRAPQAPDPARPLLMVVTGAGVSAESGLPTYRDEGGLWRGHDPKELATAAAFAADPGRVAAFHDDRRAAVAAARPNPAHHALARLEREWHGDFLLVTTNVDSLHEAAGSRRVLHLHGRLSEVRCPRCALVTEDATAPLAGMRCGGCGHVGPHRVNAVLFGERPFGLDAAFAATDRCEVFVAVGCGGAVRPANLLPRMAEGNHRREPLLGQAPCRMVEINPAPTGDPAFSEIVAGPAARELPLWVERFLASVPDGRPLVGSPRLPEPRGA